MRGWLTAKHDERFEEKNADICKTYVWAELRRQAGIETVSVDEMTGIQALERAAPTLPMKPGRVERQEFEYIRHGTRTVIAGFNVGTGQIVADIGATRTEEDYTRFLQRLFATRARKTQYYRFSVLVLHPITQKIRHF